MQSDERLRRLESLTEAPLLALALLLIPLLIVPAFFSLPERADDAILAIDWLIWAIFAVDFGLKLSVAPRRLGYLRAHWLEALMVALPMLRPLRAARVLRLARLLTALGFNLTIVRQLTSQRGTRFIALAVLALLFGGSVLVLLAERETDNANITSLGDALWWSATTMTTVGYGDHYPTTAAGRGIAVALMLFGIAALSSLTASIAALLIKTEETVTPGLEAEVRSLRDEVQALRTAIEALAGPGEPESENAN